MHSKVMICFLDDATMWGLVGCWKRRWEGDLMFFVTCSELGIESNTPVSNPVLKKKPTWYWWQLLCPSHRSALTEYTQVCPARKWPCQHWNPDPPYLKVKLSAVHCVSGCLCSLWISVPETVISLQLALLGWELKNDQFMFPELHSSSEAWDVFSPISGLSIAHHHPGGHSHLYSAGQREGLRQHWYRWWGTGFSTEKSLPPVDPCHSVLATMALVVEEGLQEHWKAAP